MSDRLKIAAFPNFEAPPVAEVICGVTFAPLQRLTGPHLGLLWTRFQSEYPICKEVDPLIPVIESFEGEEQRLPELSPVFLPRIWFVSKDENGILQVQRDRILHNWRRVRPTDEYPRYEKVKSQFANYFALFSSFISENNLGPVIAEQLEMTYLNHIPIGNDWLATGEIGKVFPDFNWRPGDRVLAAPEKVHWRTSFKLPEQAGRLHVVIQTAVRKHDGAPIVVLDLTVRGMSTSRTTDAIFSWFDRSREWIVKGFADLTGSEIQKQWKPKA